MLTDLLSSVLDTVPETKDSLFEAEDGEGVFTLHIKYRESRQIKAHATSDTIYTGDFLEGNWGLITMGCMCHGVRWRANCTIEPESQRLLKWQVMGLLKVLYSDILPFANGLVMHASSLAMGEYAQIFTGPNEAGKSTINHLLSGRLMTDDFTPILFAEGGPFVVASPFIGWEKFKFQQYQAPLSAVNRIFQSDRWDTKTIGISDAIARILENTISFADNQQVKQAILDRATELARLIPVRELSFSLDPPTKEQLHGIFQ